MLIRFACGLSLVAFLAAPLPAHAQDKEKPKRLPGDEMIEKYLAAETDNLSQRFMDGAKTLAEWKEKLPRLKREYMDMLGLWPIPEKTPLKATVTGQIEAHGVVVEKIHFQSKPGLYVTANLYRPKTPPAPPSKGGDQQGSPPLKGGDQQGSPPLKGGEQQGSPPFERGEQPVSPFLKGGEQPVSLFLKGREQPVSPPLEGGVRGGKQLPAILYVCGHSGKGRDGCKTAFQDHGFWFANNGYVCLIVDTLQLGELPGVHHGTYGRAWGHLKSWGLDVPSPGLLVSPSPLLPKGADPSPFRPWWWSLGYTPAGVECWNGIRAIDYLQSRPEVDPDKIGVTGISGGGAATFWIAAADERVKVAVPVSGMSDLESYVKNKVINGHCDCMFLYNTYQWDWTTIAALVAPRPLLFANSDNDPIFPMDGNRRIMAKLRKCYAMYPTPPAPPSQGGEKKGFSLQQRKDIKGPPLQQRGGLRDSPPLEGGAGGVLDEYVSPGGHAYRPDLRIAIFKFINKHLKGDTTSPVEDSAKYTDIPGKDLRVFPTDADLPKDAINGRIDETFVARGKVELPEKGKFAEWKNETLRLLRAQSFRNIPSKIPGAIKFGDIGSEKSMTFETEKGISVLMGPPYLREAEKRKFPIDLTLYVYRGAEEAQKISEQLLTMRDSKLGPLGPVLLFPRGTLDFEGSNPLVWAEKSPPNYVERSHLLLGKSVDEGRVLDLAVAAHSLGKRMEEGKKLKIVGVGESGILSAYAALFEPSIKEVVVIAPPKSHKEGPYFLGVLKVLDIPEALGLLAPTPLTIIGGNDPAFDRTAEIYRLAGAADKLRRK